MPGTVSGAALYAYSSAMSAYTQLQYADDHAEVCAHVRARARVRVRVRARVRVRVRVRNRVRG